MEKNMDEQFDDSASEHHVKTEVKCEPVCEDQLPDGTVVKAESTVMEEVQVKVERDEETEMQSSHLSAAVSDGYSVSHWGWAGMESEMYMRRLPEPCFGGVGSLGPAQGEQCMEGVGVCEQEQAVDRPASCGRGVGCPVVKVEGGGVSVCEREEGEGSHEEWEDTVQPQVYIEVKTESCEETGVERLGEGEEQEVEGGVHLQARAESSVATGVRWSVCGVQWSEGSSAPVSSSSSSCGVSEPGPCVSSVGTAQLSPLEEKRRSRSGQQPSGKRGRVKRAGSDVPQEAREAASPHPDVQTAHGDLMRFVCSLCDYKCTQQKTLKRHQQTIHEGTWRHQCPHCQFKTNEKGYLQKHIDAVHEGLKKFPCPQCQYRAGHKGDLKKHISVVHEGVKKYLCPRCGYRASQKWHLQNHIDAVHEGLRKYACPHCQYRAGEKSTLQKHVDTVHEGLRRFHCPHCPYKAGLKNTLQAHIENVHEKLRRYQCPHCPYRAGQKSKLQTHIDTVHEGIRRYPCPHCQYRAGHKTHLQNHLNAIHADLIH